jgi:hypothetical protein
LLQDKFSKKARAELFDFSSSHNQKSKGREQLSCTPFANGRPQTPGRLERWQEHALSSRGQATHVMARPPEAD